MQLGGDVYDTPPINLTQQWDISDQKIVDHRNLTGKNTPDRFENKKKDLPEIDFITDDPKIFH